MEQYITLNENKNYVKELQKEVGATVDGIYGNNTHQKVKEYFKTPVIIHMGKIVPIKTKLDIDLTAPLYELDDGTRNWYARKEKPSSICVHWGGLNTRHCYNVFNLAKGRHVSSHFLIGKNHKTNKYEILQCLDTGLAAYHAGKFNKNSVGVDICMHPDKKYWDKTKQWYSDAYLTEYKGNDQRVPKGEIVMIGDEFASICNDFLLALRDALELNDKPICEDLNVYSINELKQYSIVGHHNVSNKKWDIIPWIEKIYSNNNC